jgi:SsrA-binding protein
MAKPQGTKLIADNRRARHEYELLERVEAGLVLTGAEVKSLREGRVTLQQAFADARGSELWLVGLHIASYEKGGAVSHDPERDRKLLLHRREIDRLAGRARERGLTLVPTRLYFKTAARGKIALARGRGPRQAARHREARRRPPDRARSSPGLAESPAELHFERTHIRGRPGFDVVGSPAELQAEVPGRPR